MNAAMGFILAPFLSFFAFFSFFACLAGGEDPDPDDEEPFIRAGESIIAEPLPLPDDTEPPLPLIASVAARIVSRPKITAVVFIVRSFCEVCL